ncbi:MAG: transcriptional regulator [Prosthecochloris sp.]|nr:transcriptional regulator [Prosthecochloris sp.]
MSNMHNNQPPITEKPNWMEEHPDAGYCKIIKIAGDDILLASVRAKSGITLDRMDTDLMKKVLADCDIETKPVFLIWDMTHISAVSYDYKKSIARLVYNPETIFRGIVFYNVEENFMPTVETFAAIAGETVPVACCGSYREALQVVEQIRQGNKSVELFMHDDEADDSFEKRKKDFLAAIGRISWLNMLHQSISLPPADDPVYPFFKAIENLQYDLGETMKHDEQQIDQIKKEFEKVLTDQTIQLNAQQELYKQLKKQLEKEKAALTSRIASQEMELTRISTAIAEKTSTLQELLEIIRELDIDETQKKEMIESCESMIETEMIEKKLNIELTSTDSEFLLKLQKKHPNLNQRELRICLLVKLNYDTREIARSIGISTRGMESIRYRMHKKIGLSRHQSIKSYLTELASRTA